jgi:hypothetical protein
MKSVICQLAWKLGTTMYFSCFILHRAGHLEKWDHLRNPSRCFFLSGRSSGTIRPLAKPFSRFILHRAGRLEQLDHLKKSNKQKNQWKKQRKKGKEKGFSQLFFFTKLTIQSQKKINFLMPLHRKHCKEGATVVT